MWARVFKSNHPWGKKSILVLIGKIIHINELNNITIEFDIPYDLSIENKINEDFT